MINEIQPDVIFHLAAQSVTGISMEIPQQTFLENTVPARNLLESIAKQGLSSKMLIASSSEVYGIPGTMPVEEWCELAPINPYGVAKKKQEEYASLYHRQHNVNTIIARPFNHTGPGRRDDFVESSIAKQFAEMEKGMRPFVLTTGNTNIRRDFSDVRDVVRAYRLLAKSGRMGACYNICSGSSTSISEIIDVYEDITGIKVIRKTEPKLVRKVDNPITYGSNQKIRQDVGWNPKIPIRKTLYDLLNDWMSKID